MRNKENRKDVGLIILVWLFVLLLAWLTITKIKFLF